MQTNLGLIPLPSHIHYELLLQLLERQTLPALDPISPYYSQVQNVIIQLRKALAFQKQLEETCTSAGMRVDHRWSLNNPSQPTLAMTDLLSPTTVVAENPPE